MDFGIMKRILIGTALLATTFLAACGYSDFFASDDYPASSTVEPASFSHIPHEEKVLFIDPEADHQLGERDLLRLLQSGYRVVEAARNFGPAGVSDGAGHA